MRLALPLLVALTLALTGCGGAASDPTATDATGADEVTATSADEDTTDAATDEVEAPGTTKAPDAGDVETPGGDCSSFGLDDTVEGAEQLSAEARATAQFLLDAAVRCDEQLLFTAAAESETSFFFDNATADEVFALPEDPGADPSAWEALALLLGGSTPVQGDADIWTWPAAAVAGAQDAAWQELVDIGLYSPAQVDELRSAADGYLGWRVGIEADGTWLFLTAGD